MSRSRCSALLLVLLLVLGVALGAPVARAGLGDNPEEKQIKDLLTQQWTGPNSGSPKILQVSKGFAYSYSGTTLGSVTLNGAPLEDNASYRIVTNNFLADGGDGFPAFTQGTGKYFGGLDIDAFANYLEANSPYSPAPLTRITKQ